MLDAGLTLGSRPTKPSLPPRFTQNTPVPKGMGHHWQSWFQTVLGAPLTSYPELPLSQSTLSSSLSRAGTLFPGSQAMLLIKQLWKTLASIPGEP